MRRSFGIVVILLCCNWSADLRAKADPSQTTSICIEYFGVQASPLFPIVISDSKAAAELGNDETFNDTHLLFAHVHVVDPKLMAQLIPEVKAIATHEIEMRDPYVVFHVVVLRDGVREVKILDGDQTFGLVERFKSICGKGALFDDLVFLQKAIESTEGKGLNK